MHIEFDNNKDEINRRDKGISLKAAELFDWSTFIYEVDTRKDYGEVRYRGFGYIDGRLCMAAFTIRGDVFRVFSLRKANKREEKAYASKI
jgi:uncharacterized protein